MLLYGCTDSGHSYKVRSFLLLTGTAHDYQWIDLSVARARRPPEFVAASKFGEVPVLVEDGVAMCQSNVILAHLARRGARFCGDGAAWHSVLEWLSWETNRIGFSVPNLRFALLWSAQPEPVMAYLRQRALADLATLEAALADTDFLLPCGPTIADISCSAYLFWLHQIGIEEDAFPNIQRWLNRLRALPGWLHPDAALQAGAA
jgi:glutathione S-transferase